MIKKIKAFIISELILGLVTNYCGIFLFGFIDGAVSKQPINMSLKISNICEILEESLNGNTYFIPYLLIINLLVMIFSLSAVLSDSRGKIYRTGTIKVTDKIAIPIPAGNGEYGSRRFMSCRELDKVEELSFYQSNRGRPPKKGGFVIGIKSSRVPGGIDKKPIVYVGEDRHVIAVGATRSGKTRRMILESIWLTILAGENIIATDPKGEIWAYTSEFARKHGYQTAAIDFREPGKGSHYNYLQEIIDALENNDTAEAIDLTWDLVAVLVGEAKGEPIWHNGECAAIAAVILIVAMEAPDEYKNLTNVYYFLFNMAKTDELGRMPISRYLEELPETHPARAVFAMAEIAHSKTRGSFFSSALGTLKYFTNPKIAEMTSLTDIKFSEMTEKKTIIYIILPDEKTTLYGLGSMYIMQHYTYLVKATNKNGGRCPIGWWYFLDEFGQLPYIPPVPQYLSVGAGRGMRFVLVLQDFQQLKKKYKDDYNTIKNNCDCWVYLKCSNEETLKEFSTRCGNYTIQVNSTNFSDHKGMKNQGDGHSSSLTGRNLLLPEEVGLIEAPYSLICFAGKHPIMLTAPDLSCYKINGELGMGDKDHNRRLIIERNAGREERTIKEIRLWGVWNEYKTLDEEDYEDYESDCGEDGAEDGKISFLDI